MDAEGDLLRHRLRGVIEAAEGRAAHVEANARRDADETRRRAALEAVDAVSAVERELRSVLQRLSATVTRIEATLDAGADAEPRSPGGPARFGRASMRDRPVAALFEAAGDREREPPAVRRLG